MFSLTVLKERSAAWVQRMRNGGGAAQADAAPAASQPQMRDGKVFTQACELPIVRHCNLSCRSCTHLSPVLPRHCADPAEIARDLTILGRHYHVRTARVMGGEPLLHPRLIEILTFLRRSGFCDRIRVVTNGVLLARQTDELWRHCDEVEVSLYPGHELSEDDLELCQSRADAHGLLLRAKQFDRFRESHALLGTDDDALVGRIYRTCNIAHVWSCHNVDGGYFFKCPEAMLLPEVLGESQRARLRSDGLKIDDSPAFADALLAYLRSPQPLSACRYCLGSVGTLFDHEEVPRKQWTDPQRHTSEQLLDREFLQLLEETPGAPWMCTRGDISNPANRAAVERLGLPKSDR